MNTDGYYILDAERRPFSINVKNRADLLAWHEFFTHGDRRVGVTKIADGVVVSTTFIGIDLRTAKSGPPLLFETMIFGGQLDRETWRYASWDDAETGHKAAVRRATKMV